MTKLLSGCGAPPNRLEILLVKFKGFAAILFRLFEAIFIVGFSVRVQGKKKKKKNIERKKNFFSLR
jgi:hypothetical protein